LVPVALGLFALPEIVDLVIKGTSISDVPKDAMKGVGRGMRDAFQHWFLVVRCSVVGVWVGATPGLGASVVDWFDLWRFDVGLFADLLSPWPFGRAARAEF
jgi:TctA family transporter